MLLNLFKKHTSAVLQLGLRCIATSQARASLAAAEKLVAEMKGKRKMPWENAIPEDEAAYRLSSFFGTSTSIRPGDILDLDVNQIEALLRATTLHGGSKELDEALFAHAESVTRRFFGSDVYFRGIVEFSNVCEFDCYYCGVRKHQPRTWRYTMPMDEVVEVSEWAFDHQMGTIMLQSGQLNTPQRNEYIMEMIKRIREKTVAMDLFQRTLNTSNPDRDLSNELGLCVALSVGELPFSLYKAFHDAGAARYLLRIETSNPDLYKTLHPEHQKWDARVRALEDAKDAGFMLGTGVMVGLPGQSLRDLASDIVFFKSIEADMIGMGPYITEPGTPATEMWEQQYGHVDKTTHMKEMVQLMTRMNALARITLGNVNIAATTALQAIDPVGREIALRRGANVLMPILTPTKYREHYTLYEGKPCITDTAEECQKCLHARLSMVGKKLKPGIWGDPPSYRERLRPVSLRNAHNTATGAGTNSSNFHTSAAMHRLSNPIPQPERECDICGFTTAKADIIGVDSAGPASKQGAVDAVSRDCALPKKIPKGSDTPRTNIGIFGRMNSGKSSLMNTITRSEVSIVDSTPGTTADTKIALMELHAAGPVKIFDTAGIDEEGSLGEKKRRKVLSTLKECDLSIVVINLGHLLGNSQLPLLTNNTKELEELLRWEKLLVERSLQAGAVPVLVFNAPNHVVSDHPKEHLETLKESARKIVDPHHKLSTHSIDIASPASSSSAYDFVEEAAKAAGAAHAVPCLPRRYLSPDAMVFLNIPMDEETPSMRLLRPQALVQEESIRKFATTIAYRMDLNAARSPDKEDVERERRRFLKALQPILKHDGPAIIVTDSQAVDIVHPWTLDVETGRPMVPFTTFSIAMIQRQSRGNLPTFVEGIGALKRLQPGDRVLVAEACNHNRITETCNDIGMVQIPNKLQASVGGSPGNHIDGEGTKGIVIEHAFGREFPELDDPESGGLKRFKLAVHCGGCMVDAQKIVARVSDLREAGVPVTNYGLLLAYAHSPEAMKRALEPWEVQVEHL